jgi:ATP-dependent Clp protease ATP-binding subunit ClpA
MIEQGLQQEINMVMTEARNRRLEFVTVEHLLLALLNMDEVIAFLRGKRVNIDELRAELEQYIDSHTPIISEDAEIDIVPTVGFQRVLQRSVYQAQSAQKNSVNAMNVFVSIFSEKESHAVYMLKLNNISRLDVMEGISSQLADSPAEETKKVDGEKSTKPSSLDSLQVIFVKKQGWERLILYWVERRRFFEQFRFYQDVEKIIHYLLVRQELEKLQLLKG